MPPTPFSLLLSLPPELRTQIYTLALHSPAPACHCYPPTPHPPYPALLLVSRLVNREATPLFYKHLSFVAHPSMLTAFPAYKFAPMVDAEPETTCPRCCDGGNRSSSSSSLSGGRTSTTKIRSFHGTTRLSSPLLHLREDTSIWLRRWTLSIRLDAGPRFSAAAAAAAFSGCRELFVEASQASFGVAGVENLLRLQDVRGVKRASVEGARVEGFRAWLEGVMMLPVGAHGKGWEEVCEERRLQDEARKSGLGEVVQVVNADGRVQLMPVSTGRSYLGGWNAPGGGGGAPADVWAMR